MLEDKNAILFIQTYLLFGFPVNPRRQRQRDLCPLGEHSVLVPQVLSAHGSNLYQENIFPGSVSYPMYIDNPSDIKYN